MKVQFFSEKNPAYFTKEMNPLMQKSLLILSLLGILWACQPAEKAEPGTEKTISVKEMAVVNASWATYLITPQEDLILIGKK
jgi:hypothetical protein